MFLSFKNTLYVHGRPAGVGTGSPGAEKHGQGPGSVLQQVSPFNAAGGRGHGPEPAGCSSTRTSRLEPRRRLALTRVSPTRWASAGRWPAGVHNTTALDDRGSCHLAHRRAPGRPEGRAGRHTEVWTGVPECAGEEPRSEEDEARVATSRCRSSTLFCSSARMASSSLRFWWMGICGQTRGLSTRPPQPALQLAPGWPWSHSALLPGWLGPQRRQGAKTVGQAGRGSPPPNLVSVHLCKQLCRLKRRVVLWVPGRGRRPGGGRLPLPPGLGLSIPPLNPLGGGGGFSWAPGPPHLTTCSGAVLGTCRGPREPRLGVSLEERDRVGREVASRGAQEAWGGVQGTTPASLVPRLGSAQQPQACVLSLSQAQGHALNMRQ